MSLILPGGPVLGSFPSRMKPYNNTTPMTYQDGLTYLEVLESMREWLRDHLIPHINSQATDIMDQFNASTEALNKAMIEYTKGIEADREAYKTDIAADRKAFEDRVKEREDALAAELNQARTDIENTVSGIESFALRSEAGAADAERFSVEAKGWADASAAVQDNKVKSLLADTTSATRTYLETVLSAYGKSSTLNTTIERVAALEEAKTATNGRVTALEVALPPVSTRVASLETSRTKSLNSGSVRRSSTAVTIGTGAWNILDTSTWWQVEHAFGGNLTFDGSILIGEDGVYDVFATAQVDVQTALALGIKKNSRNSVDTSGMIASNVSSSVASYSSCYVARRIPLLKNDRLRVVMNVSATGPWSTFNLDSSTFGAKYVEPLR